MQVGDVLTQILAQEWNVPACERCKETARKMNELGVEGCREKLDELAEDLHQNAKAMKWSTLMAAAVKVTDAVTQPVVGNSLYKSMIERACQYAERVQLPCVHTGQLEGTTPWSRRLPRHLCLCPEIEQRFSTPVVINDRGRARCDDIAICADCEHYQPQEPSE